MSTWYKNSSNYYIGIFIIVGLLTVLIDFFAYSLLIIYFSVDTPISKGIGFVSGVVFSYFANKKFTFQSKKTMASTILPFVLIYSISLTANISVNSLIINMLAGVNFLYIIAFFIATGLSTIINFFGMRNFVFER